MCGRFQMQLSPRKAAMQLRAEEGPWLHEALGETYNAAPGQILPVLHVGAEGHHVLDGALWSLPSLTPPTDGSAPRSFVNVRVEGATKRPSFREAARTGRVLVPATGFYEWQAPVAGGKVKTPHSIRVAGDDPERLFLMAGIASEFEGEDGHTHLQFAVLTTQPNELCAPIHKRMPVILEGDLANAWIETPPEGTDALFAAVREPFPAERMEAWPVGRDVNAAGNDGPHLIERVESQQPATTQRQDPPLTLFE